MASLTGAPRALARIANRMRMLVARAVVRLVNDGAGIQIVQVSAMKGETRAELERFQAYGFSSVPFPGAEAVVLFVGGDRAHGLVLAIDDRRYRLKNLQPGELALYTDEGDKIVLKRDRKIEITSGAEVLVTAATKIRIDCAAALELEGSTITINGTASVVVTSPSVTIQGKNFLTHQHTGVQTGAGNTGGVL